MQVHNLLSKFLRQATWHGNKKSNNVYLTFDDGPIPEVTPWVLDQADKWNVKLTFFCVGDNVRKYPDVYNEILRRGHSVGSHTFNHLQAWKCSKETYFSNVEKASKYIDTKLFRPPHGQLWASYQKPLLQQFDKIIMWNLLSFDYNKNLSPQKVFSNVEKNIGNGSIVVFHDSLKAEERMKYAFIKTLELINERGYVASKITSDSF